MLLYFTIYINLIALFKHEKCLNNGHKCDILCKNKIINIFTALPHLILQEIFTLQKHLVLKIRLQRFLLKLKIFKTYIHAIKKKQD